MKWFKHGSNMRNDAKLRRVINRYGLEGYGLYNLIVESIVESLDTDSPIPILEENIEDIAEFYNSNTSRIKEMLHFMVNQKLFDFTDNNEIICIKVFKHLQSSQTRSEALRKLISNYNKNKPKLIESDIVLDSLLHVEDNDKDDLNDNTTVLDNCEEEKRRRREEKEKRIKGSDNTPEKFPGFQPLEKESGLYNSIKEIFLSKNNNHFDNWGKEGKSIKNLVEKAHHRENPEIFMQNMLETFYNLTQGNQNWWKDQPFLPSVLNSNGIFPRVEKQLEEKNSNANFDYEDQFEKATGG